MRNSGEAVGMVRCAHGAHDANTFKRTAWRGPAGDNAQGYELGANDTTSAKSLVPRLVAGGYQFGRIYRSNGPHMVALRVRLALETARGFWERGRGLACMDSSCTL